MQRSAGASEGLLVGYLSGVRHPGDRASHRGCSHEYGRGLPAKIFWQHGAAIQAAIAVEVNPVAGLVNEVGGGELAGERAAGGRAFDEIVANEIGVMIGARVAADEPGDAPVINHVVDVLNGPFGLGIAALVANPEIADERNLLALAKTTESLRGDARPDDAVLESDVFADIHINRVPTAPLNGNMIEDHIPPPGNVNGALFVLTRGQALANAQMPNNGVVCV